MEPVRTRFLDLGPTGTRLLESGPQEATEAVLFVHGNPGSATDWEGLLEVAGRLGRAVAFDMPGFGRCRRPPGFRAQVPSYAAFIERARKELGIEEVHLVLHDFGGPFGLVWGLQHPDRWRSVTLINVGVLPGYRWHTMARLWRTPLVGELVQLWIPKRLWEILMARVNPKGLPTEFVEKMYREYDRETRNTVLELYRATPDRSANWEELGEAFAKLRKPALVVWGEQDPFIPARYAPRQREFFAVEHELLLPESGHWPFIDDPQPVAEALESFLSRQLVTTT